jgi:hypothetical protein
MKRSRKDGRAPFIRHKIRGVIKRRENWDPPLQ